MVSASAGPRKRTEEALNMTSKCERGHNWRTPEPGDTALDCTDCGRVLDRHTEITPNMTGAIMQRVKRLAGLDTQRIHAFEGFFGYGPLVDISIRVSEPVVRKVDTSGVNILPQKVRRVSVGNILKK